MQIELWDVFGTVSVEWNRRERRCRDALLMEEKKVGTREVGVDISISRGASRVQKLCAVFFLFSFPFFSFLSSPPYHKNVNSPAIRRS